MNDAAHPGTVERGLVSDESLIVNAAIVIVAILIVAAAFALAYALPVTGVAQ